jgi:hypothetical protein
VKRESSTGRGNVMRNIEGSAGFNFHKADYEIISEVLDSIDWRRSLKGKSVER